MFSLASFTRTLISGRSPFDRFTYSNEGEALSASARRGMELFFSEQLECHHCHGGFNFSDSSLHDNADAAPSPFHNTGLYNLDVEEDGCDGLGSYPAANQGLFEITAECDDRGKFRAPALRNVEVTAPRVLRSDFVKLSVMGVAKPEQTVSVVIPTFNRKEQVARAVESVLQQTQPPLEVIVVDDGSTDGTSLALAAAFPQIGVVHQARGGVSAARNAGIRASRGAWVALLDSDDEWMAEKLERQLMTSHSASARLIHSDEIWVRNGVRVNPMKKHRKHGGYIFESCIPRCCISPSSTLIHRSVFGTVGFFDETLPACEDYDLWLRICARFPVTYVDEKLVTRYAGHADQLSQQHWGMDRFRIKALENLLRTAQLSREQKRAVLFSIIRRLTIMRNGAEKRARSMFVQELDHARAVHQATLAEVERA